MSFFPSVGAPPAQTFPARCRLLLYTIHVPTQTEEIAAGGRHRASLLGACVLTALTTLTRRPRVFHEPNHRHRGAKFSQKVLHGDTFPITEKVTGGPPATVFYSTDPLEGSPKLKECHASPEKGGRHWNDPRKDLVRELSENTSFGVDATLHWIATQVLRKSVRRGCVVMHTPQAGSVCKAHTIQ